MTAKRREKKYCAVVVVHFLAKSDAEAEHIADAAASRAAREPNVVEAYMDSVERIPDEP